MLKLWGEARKNIRTIKPRGSERGLSYLELSMEDKSEFKKRPKCPICGSSIGDYDKKAGTVWCSNKECELYDEELNISLWELFNDK
jgi:hypothetical protein